MERFAPRYDALAFTLVEMVGACVGLLAVALVARAAARAARLDGLGRAARDRRLRERARVSRRRRGRSARTTATRTALAFSLEPVWAAFFGVTLAGDRLGWPAGRLRGDHGRHRARRAGRGDTLVASCEAEPHDRRPARARLGGALRRR